MEEDREKEREEEFAGGCVSNIKFEARIKSGLTASGVCVCVCVCVCVVCSWVVLSRESPG